MDPKELRGLMEAYSEVYAPQEVDEAVKGESSERRSDLAAERRAGRRPKSAKEGEAYASHKLSQMAYVKRQRMGEEVEQIDEISQKTATSAYAQRRTGEFEGDDASDRVAKTNKLKGRIEKKFGAKAGEHAEKAADVKTFGRKDASGRRQQRPEPRIQTSDHENQREFKRELRIKRDRRLRAARGEDTNEQVDIFDVVLEFLQVEGYAETLEEAEWLMANVIDEEAIAIILGEEYVDEAIYSEKGKAKAAEMIAKRSTPSGRAKSGQGASVAAIKHIGRSEREGLRGTPMTPTMAKNPAKSRTFSGTGNKAARRAGLTPTREKPNAWKEDFELWVNELVEEGYDLSDYTWDEMYEFYLDEDAGIVSGLAGLALGAKGASYAAKHTKRLRDYPKNFVKGIVDPRTYVPKKKKEQKEEFEAWLDEAMSSYDKNRKRAAARAEERNRLRQAGKLSGPMERISLRDKFGDAAGTRMAKAKPPGPGEKY